jgi:hypothetical protein
VIAIWLLAVGTSLVPSSWPSVRCAEEEYSPKGGNFSVQFPGRPKEASQTTKSPIGDVKVYTATYATKEGNVYMVSYSDLPSGATKAENLDTLFEGVREGAKGKDGNAKVIVGERYDYTRDKLKLPAYKLELTNEKNNQSLKFRIVINENRLYQLAVVGSPEFAKSSSAAEFLNSFELSK